MKFQNGEILTLNNIRYGIQERLGRGAVSDVYLAQLDGANDAQVVIKVVRDDAADDPLKVEALQCEADTLRLLNRAEDAQWDTRPDARARFRQAQQTFLRRQVIAALDTGELTSGQPFVVQELAPPAFERFSIETPADEARLLKIAHAALDVLALTHHNGMSLKDFEPTTKGDRIRLQWLDDAQQTFILKVIDWNITGGPEDMAQDLFYFGGHLYYWLTGRHVYVDGDGRTPANLGMGNPAWGTLTAGTRQLVAKLLHRDAQRRYTSVDMLVADVTWWNEVLAQIETTSIFRRLDDRLWQARPAGRYDRVRAIADLALRFTPPADARQSFEQSLKQAQDELDKENWQPIAHAQVTLGTRAYEKAALEFTQQLRILPPESEAARLAHIYHLLAGVGGLLKRHYQGMDERTSPEWEALETRAIPALVQRRWADAQSALAEVNRIQPEARNWPTLSDLIEWAVSGVQYVREVTPAFMKAENGADPLSDAWLQAEEAKLKEHQAAVQALETVQQKAPFEPEFKERLEIEQVQLTLREKLYGVYARADEVQKQAQPVFQSARQADTQQQYALAADGYQNAGQKFETVRDLFQEVLQADATQRRAQLGLRRVQKSLDDAQTLYQQAAALHQAQQDLAANRYDQALEQLHYVLRLAPGRKDALALVSEVNHQQQTTLLVEAKKRIAAGAYTEARPYVQQVIRLAPDRKDAQEMDVEVGAGEQWVERVRIYQQGAETYLNNDEFDQALDQLRRCDGLDGRALRDLPDGQSLPPAVGAQPFRLPADLRARTGVLRQQIETTREARDNVQRAWDDYDFTEVVSLCAALRERYPLTPTLERRADEAQQRLTHRQTAALKIAQAEEFGALREALRLIEGDAGAEASRVQAADQWVGLTQALARQLTTEEHWQDLLARLSEGQRLFPPYAETFKGMQTLARRAHDLAMPPVALSADARPAWLDYADWPARLARVEEELAAVLSASQSWSQMHQLATPWRARLYQHLEFFLQRRFAALEAQYPSKGELLRHSWDLWGSLPVRARESLPRSLLETFLQKQLGEIRALARQQQDFAAAHAGVEALWGGFPESLRAEPPPGLLTEVHEFRAQLAIRMAADEGFDAELQRLADPTYTFQDADKVVKPIPLPDHADIPKTDLEAVRTELAQAAPVEALRPVTPVTALTPPEGQLNYAQLIHRCREDAVPVLDTLGAHPDLSGRVKALRSLLRDKREETFQNLESALSEAVKAQQTHPETDPRTVLDLYQQAWWAQSVATTLDKPPSDAMVSAQKLPQEILKKAAALFVKVRDLVDFADPERLLERVVTLNNALLRYESDKLPPLPEKVSRAEMGQSWQLPAGALEQLCNAVAELKKHIQTAMTLQVKDEAGASYNAEQTRAVQTLTRQLQPVVERLSGAWAALSLAHWTAADSLAQLRAEIPHHETVADQCGEAYRLLQSTEAMQGLQVLSQHLEEKAIVSALRGATLPLLTRPRQALLLNYAALRQDLIAALGQQIAAILPARDAAEQLQIQVLERVHAPDIGDAAYQAIREGVALRAQQAQEEGRKDEAIRLWKVVMDATERWAKADLDAAALATAQSAQATAKAPAKSGKKATPPPDEPHGRELESAPPPAATPERRAVPSVKGASHASKPPMRKKE